MGTRTRKAQSPHENRMEEQPPHEKIVGTRGREPQAPKVGETAQWGSNSWFATSLRRHLRRIYRPVRAASTAPTRRAVDPAPIIVNLCYHHDG